MLFKPLVRLACNSCNWSSLRSMSGLLIEERKLDILTCKHLFGKESKSQGLKFEVTYLDGQLEDNRDNPVVLFLPGAPGGYQDFKLQIPDLLNSGARVIAPNFPELPELVQYRNPKCKNTPENKSAYVRDFLSAIGVNRVDMLVTHSSGVYTGLRLFRFPENLSIKSLVMINPLGHWHTTTRPAWLYWPLCEMVNYPLGYKFLQKFGKPIINVISPVEVPNIDAPLLGLASIRSFNIKEVREGYDEIARKKPPLLFMFSDNDRLLKKKVSHEMLDIFGSKKEDWWYHDENGRLVKKGKEGDWIKVLNFKKGSHYSLRKHPETVAQAMVGFLKQTAASSPLTSIQDINLTIEPKLSGELCQSTTCFHEKRQLSNQI